MQEKSKRDNVSRPRINRLTFFLLWIVLSAGLSFFSHTVFMWFLSWLAQIPGGSSLIDSVWRVVLLESLLSASLTAPVEKVLLKLAFGQWIRGWISARMLGTVIGMMPFIVLQAFNLQHLAMNDAQNVLLISLTAGIAFLPLAWVLRRYMQKAWRFPIVAMLSSLVPVAVVPFVIGSAFGPVFTLGSLAAVFALMMLWVFGERPAAEKVKTAEAARYERLEEPAAEGEENQPEVFETEQKEQVKTVMSKRS